MSLVSSSFLSLGARNDISCQICPSSLKKWIVLLPHPCLDLFDEEWSPCNHHILAIYNKTKLFCFSGISLLERLMTSCNTYEREPNGGYNPNLLTKLVNNYRSHRDIIEIPKQLFYENELNECAGDFR